MQPALPADEAQRLRLPAGLRVHDAPSGPGVVDRLAAELRRSGAAPR